MIKRRKKECFYEPVVCLMIHMADWQRIRAVQGRKTEKNVSHEKVSANTSLRRGASVEYA